jgi:hypothetical protein
VFEASFLINGKRILLIKTISRLDIFSIS